MGALAIACLLISVGSGCGDTDDNDLGTGTDAGMDAGTDFEMDIGAPDTGSDLVCERDERASQGACVDCPAGTSNEAGDRPAIEETNCEPLLCLADERVVDNECVECPPGTTNTAGDDASGANTSCDPVLCGQDEFVSSHACAACAPGTTNAAGDDASGPNTTCDDACAAALGVTCPDFEEAYIKASTPDDDDEFGWSVALDGETLAVGVPYEDSNATGVGGNQADNSASDSGAVYVRKIAP